MNWHCVNWSWNGHMWLSLSLPLSPRPHTCAHPCIPQWPGCHSAALSLWTAAPLHWPRILSFNDLFINLSSPLESEPLRTQPVFDFVSFHLTVVSPTSRMGSGTHSFLRKYFSAKKQQLFITVYALHQGSANYSPEAKSNPPPMALKLRCFLCVCVCVCVLMFS